MFEVIFRYYRWSWLWNHENRLVLEIGFDLLIICVVFYLTTQQQKKIIVPIVVSLVIMMITSLCGRTPLHKIPLDRVIEILKDGTQTDLQKADFCKRHNGQKVEWKGYVDFVGFLDNRMDSKEIILKFRPESQREESSPTLVIASFPLSAKKDLFDIRKADLIKAQGMLYIKDTRIIHLNDCKMIDWFHTPRRHQSEKKIMGAQ